MLFSSAGTTDRTALQAATALTSLLFLCPVTLSGASELAQQLGIAYRCAG